MSTGTAGGGTRGDLHGDRATGEVTAAPKKENNCGVEVKERAKENRKQRTIEDRRRELWHGMVVIGCTVRILIFTAFTTHPTPKKQIASIVNNIKYRR